MKITLKKFSSNPYKYIKKAPLTIVMGSTPRFMLVPYASYQGSSAFSHQNAQNHIDLTQKVIKSEQNTPEIHKKSRFYRLLFS